MQQELLIALLAGLGGMLGWGFADFFAKKTIDEIGSIASLVWAHVFGTIVLTVIALLNVFILGNQISVPNDIGTWGLLFCFGTLQAIVYLFVYQGFEKGQIALLNPVFASYSGVVAVLSILLIGELLNLPLLLSLAFIFGGILLLNLDMQALRAKRININSIPGLKEVGLASILAALWTLTWDNFIGGKDWLLFALLMYAFMTLAAFVIAKAYRVKLSGIVKRDLWKFLFLIGFCEVIAYLAISLGFSMTSYTSIVALLSGAFSLPTIILARIFLKEKVTIVQTIGSLIIIIGIIILSLQ